MSTPLSYNEQVRQYVAARLAGQDPTAPTLSFTPIATGLGLIYIRITDLLSCTVCHAAVLASAQAAHQQWHEDMVRADLRWYLGDGTQRVATADELMPRPPAAGTS